MNKNERHRHNLFYHHFSAMYLRTVKNGGSHIEFQNDLFTTNVEIYYDRSGRLPTELIPEFLADLNDFPQPLEYDDCLHRFIESRGLVTGHPEKTEESEPLSKEQSLYSMGLCRIMMQRDFDRLTKAVAIRRWQTQHNRPLFDYWEQIIKSASPADIEKAEKLIAGHDFKRTMPTRQRGELAESFQVRVKEWQESRQKLFG